MSWLFGFLAAWLLNALTLQLTAIIVPGVTIKRFQGALWGALALGIVSSVVAPVILFLSIPLTILTLGLFYLVAIGGLFMLASKLAPDFEVEGCLSAIGGAIILSLVNWALGWSVHMSGWW